MKGIYPKVGAGIYRNADEGLISLSSNGKDWITISDKNVGATKVYRRQDSASQENCGCYFQRGNNYMFPHGGSSYGGRSSNSVDTTGYGPGNYYSSSTRVQLVTRFDPINLNLWGSETGTPTAMQGPCNVGFHVPSSNELGMLTNIMNDFSLSSTQYTDYLKMPAIHYRSRESVRQYACYYWSSTLRYNSSYNIYYCTCSTLGGLADVTCGCGCPIRPFYNTAVIPPLFSTKWEKLY